MLPIATPLCLSFNQILSDVDGHCQDDDKSPDNVLEIGVNS